MSLCPSYLSYSSSGLFSLKKYKKKMKENKNFVCCICDFIGLQYYNDKKSEIF